MFSDFFDFDKRDGSRYQGAPVHTSQRTWELSMMVHIYELMKPVNVVEIGSEYGGTLFFWLTKAQKGAKVVSIDLYTPEVVPVHPEEIWRSWVPDGVEYHALWGNSQDDETQKSLKAIMPEIDFLFIDGDHTYEGSKADFLRYGPMVKKGGIIAFHDLIKPDFSPHIGVGELWREIQNAGYTTSELYADNPKTQRWGGIGVVYV